MPEFISQAGESSDEFDTLIPSLSDQPDIVEAFRLYHYGRPGQLSPPEELSIHGHLNDLTESLQLIEGTIDFLQEEYPPLSASSEFIESSIANLANEYASLTASAGTINSSVLILSASAEVLGASAQVIGASATEINNSFSSISASVSSLSQDISSIKFLGIKSVSTPTYTLDINDVNKIIEMNASSSTTVTIPNSSSVNFPIGSTINIIRFSTASVQIVGASGVTILSTDNFRNLEKQYSGATLYKYLSNTWLLIGSLA